MLCLSHRPLTVTVILLLLQLDQHYFDPTGLECPVLTFAMRRRDADKLSVIYTGAPQPEVGVAKQGVPDAHSSRTLQCFVVDVSSCGYVQLRGNGVAKQGIPNAQPLC
jgi:hypothetical protein